MVIQLLVDDFNPSSTETFDVHVPRFIKSKLSIKIFHISEKILLVMSIAITKLVCLNVYYITKKNEVNKKAHL